MRETLQAGTEVVYIETEGGYDPIRYSFGSGTLSEGEYGPHLGTEDFPVYPTHTVAVKNDDYSAAVAKLRRKLENDLMAHVDKTLADFDRYFSHG